MRFLNGLVTSCRSWVSKTARRPAAGTGPEVPIDEGEHVTRFVFQKDRLYKDGRAKPKAFYPEPYRGALELSVCRLQGCAEDRVWHLGRTCRADVQLHVRADFPARAALDEKLRGFCAPEKDYEEHAVFVGWPEEPDGDKPLRLKMAQAIAAASAVKKLPDN